jgi:hypothetical protein
MYALDEVPICTLSGNGISRNIFALLVSRNIFALSAFKRKVDLFPLECKYA